MPEIVLVQPPNPVLVDPTTRWPLGLAYLEAVLLQQGYTVAVADLRDKGEDVSLIPPAPVIGFTATTGEIESAKRMARMVRERDPNTLTVIGGAHATHLYEDCSTHFDIVVRGEADGSVAEILQPRHKGTILTCGAVRNLDALPFPTRHPFSFSETLFEGAGYGKGPKATSILSSRGCPYRCAYCQTEPRPVRFRSPEGVAEEIARIQQDWDCHLFRVEDDTLTLNKKRALALFKALEPLHINWRAHSRSDAWDDDLAEAAKAAGCSEMGFGFESATDAVLEKVRKGETVDQHRQAVRICKRHGIRCKAFWMTSLPGETWKTIEDMKRFMLEERPEKYIVSSFCPYPGSDIWAHPERYGVKSLDNDFTHYWNFWDSPVVEYENVAKEELALHYRDLVSWLAKEFPR